MAPETSARKERFGPRHGPLSAFAAAMAVTTVVSAVGLAVDDRMLGGVPLWLKPLKFSISLLIYSLTLAWVLSLRRRGRRLGWWIGTVTAVAGTMEMVAIIGQAVRGRHSHFNVETPLDQATFHLMGVTITVLWSATLLLAVLLLRDRSSALSGEPAAVSALRSGVLLAVAGMAVGFLMVVPTAEQRAAERPVATGAHSVKVPDGGPGMPMTGWSTTGGDLRVPHFAGTHALQALPLFSAGLVLAAKRAPHRSRLREPVVRLRLARTAAGAATAGLALLIWQALRGQPLLSPDAATLTALGAVLAASAVAAVVSVRLPVPQAPPRRTAGTTRSAEPVPAAARGRSDGRGQTA